ncbi:RNase H domain-containing protein [Forsythia ovata]|uniref:RNase H domain-containing protein n=1 Tax=Forsythia ovata TaxID=205694 RepID=A0ABD1WQH5_9LAMI
MSLLRLASVFKLGHPSRHLRMAMENFLISKSLAASLRHYEKSGSYSVRSGYKVILIESVKEVGPSSNGTRWWWCVLWHLKIPPKIRIFIWHLYHDAIPPKTNLISRRYWSQTSMAVSGLLACYSTLHWRSVVDLFLQLFKINTADICKGVCCVAWFIWRERNCVLPGSERRHVPKAVRLVNNAAVVQPFVKARRGIKRADEEEQLVQEIQGPEDNDAAFITIHMLLRTMIQSRSTSNSFIIP